MLVVMLKKRLIFSSLHSPACGLEINICHVLKRRCVLFAEDLQAAMKHEKEVTHYFTLYFELEVDK